MPQIHVPGDDNAVHRCRDFAVTEIRLRALQRRFLDHHRRLRLRQFRRGLVQIQLGGRLERHQDFLPLQILMLQRHIGPGAGQIAFGLPQRRLVNGRINLGHQRPLFHRGIEIRVQRGNFTGHLTAHIHADHGAQRAAGRGALDNGSPGGRHRFVTGRAAGRFAAGQQTKARHQRQTGGPVQLIPEFLLVFEFSFHDM